jgi:GH15 family glucan-1,4-alpha-glucosidase
LCLPRFDSPSFFNRILDWSQGGHFSITPQPSYSSRRWYHESSAVLVTEFHTQNGALRLTDAMPVASETEQHTRLSPFRSLIRRIEGLEGTVPVQVIFKPRPEHGRLAPAFHRRGRYGYFADLGNRLIHLATELDLETKRGEVSGSLHISRGQSVVLWMSYSEDAPAVYPSLLDAVAAIERTSVYWSKWAEQCTYAGPYRKTVLRSALTLKLLTYAPSGAIVAAPTTSLPEVIGGVRNWDYRYCWLRDASLTAQLFFRLGYRSEPIAFVRWLLHATALTYPALQVLYDLHGEAKLPEKSLPFLEGYRKSSPVRIGNRAHDQLQLDVYGEVIGALHFYVEVGNELDSEMRRRVIRMADLVAARWELPDHGMWEIRTDRRQYLHSKVMCWVALAGAERLTERFASPSDVSHWAEARERIRQLIDEIGYSDEVRSFVQTLGGKEADALTLTLPLLGFIDAADPRFVSTIEHVRAALGVDGLIRRYNANDGLPGDEGAFLACSFWLVEALSVTGKDEEARQLFEQLQSLTNDVGLFSEEIDPETGELIGNFPQALTHLAHISAALRLDQKR